MNRYLSSSYAGSIMEYNSILIEMLSSIKRTGKSLVVQKELNAADRKEERETYCFGCSFSQEILAVLDERKKEKGISLFRVSEEQNADCEILRV
jgi:hypothetical protein